MDISSIGASISANPVKSKAAEEAQQQRADAAKARTSPSVTRPADQVTLSSQALAQLTAESETAETREPPVVRGSGAVRDASTSAQATSLDSEDAEALSARIQSMIAQQPALAAAAQANNRLAQVLDLTR